MAGSDALRRLMDEQAKAFVCRRRSCGAASKGCPTRSFWQRPAGCFPARIGVKIGSRNFSSL